MNDAERLDIEMLLPWYATGKLSRAEKLRVDEALVIDAELRRQSELIGQELAQTVASNEGIIPPSSFNFDRIALALGHEKDAFTAVTFNWFTRLKEAFNGPARLPLRLGAVVGILLLTLQSGAIATLVMQRQADGYRMAGSPNGRELSGTYALVRMNDTASIADIGKALQQRSMRIVDGPMADGFYSLRLGDAGMSIAERDAKISELRSLTGLVVFASPLK